jgi:hypothetical protein
MRVLGKKKLIGSRFRVQGSEVKTDGYGTPYWSRFGIPDRPHWVKRFYKRYEARIIQI